MQRKGEQVDHFWQESDYEDFHLLDSAPLQQHSLLSLCQNLPLDAWQANDQISCRD